MFSALVGESFGGGSVSFHENRLVNGTVWEEIEKLKNGEVSDSESPTATTNWFSVYNV